jgi:hypothetical protein
MYEGHGVGIYTLHVPKLVISIIQRTILSNKEKT